MALTFLLSSSLWLAVALGHTHHHHQHHASASADKIARWKDGYSFTGITTFAHLPHVECLLEPTAPFDLAVIGVPYDTSVVYRPGARFGPRAIRAASQRQSPARGFNHAQGINPYMNWAMVLDCGDIPVTPLDNAVAFPQMTEGYRDLLRRPAHTQPTTPHLDVRGKDGIYHPRLVTLGGDHSAALPALWALCEIYGPVAVLHFDSHLDTYDPASLSGYWSSEQSDYNHGTPFWFASKEGLIGSKGNLHAGLRSRLFGNDYTTYEDDAKLSFQYIETEDLDTMGINGVATRILETIGDRLVYISIDIDVLEPGIAPGTGCPESGGWTTRELKSILRRLTSLRIVGADVVEVSPPYDDRAESTAWAAADLVYELFGLMVGNPLYPVDGLISRTKHHAKVGGSKSQKDEL